MTISFVSLKLYESGHLSSTLTRNEAIEIESGIYKPSLLINIKFSVAASGSHDQ